MNLTELSTRQRPSVAAAVALVALFGLPDTATASWTVGQLVSVAVPIKAREISLAVPRDALVLRRNWSFVFRINSENKAERIAVNIGDSSGDLVSVTGALAEGDRVAIRGAENLREGASVKIIVSQSERDSTAKGG